MANRQREFERRRVEAKRCRGCGVWIDDREDLCEDCEDRQSPSTHRSFDDDVKAASGAD